MDRRAAAAAIVALLALTGCASPRTAAVPATGRSTAVDVCALVPAAQLRDAIGADPGIGVAGQGPLDGGRCTWTVSGTHTALAQLTRQPDANLPDGVWQRPDSASDVPGATRGFAAAATHTILVVKNGRGLLFTEVALRRADQSAYAALGKAIAARL